MKGFGFVLMVTIGALLTIYGAIKLTQESNSDKRNPTSKNIKQPENQPKDQPKDGPKDVPKDQPKDTPKDQPKDQPKDPKNPIDSQQDPAITKKKFDDLMKVVDELRAQDEWQKALELLEKSILELKTFEDELEKIRKQLKALKDNTLDQIIKPKFASARKLFKEGNTAAAIGELDYIKNLKLKVNYPAQYEDFVKLIDEMKEKLSQMVLLPKCEIIIGEGNSAKKITVDEFYCDIYEVTNEQYALFVLATNYHPPDGWPKGKIPVEREKHPVRLVTLEDAMAYAKWCGKRLPDEIEWERAARGPDQLVYPWGAKFQPKEGEYCCNSAEYSIHRQKPDTMPVGSFKSGQSKDLISDLIGNVWEWTVTIEEDAKGKKNVTKGGSFTTTRDVCKINSRHPEDPALKHVDLGFRCVK